MKIHHLLPLLVAALFALTSCSDSQDGNYTGLGSDGSPLPNGGGGDKVDTSTGFQENQRPNGINPDADVDYTTLSAQTVYFAFDSSVIPGAERAKLQQVSDWLKANPGRSLFLAGHADKRGTPEYNRALGERRALSVREYLVGLGVPPATIFTTSYGSDRPAANGDTEAAFAKNRRVQIGLIMKRL